MRQRRLSGHPIHLRSVGGLPSLGSICIGVRHKPAEVCPYPASGREHMAAFHLLDFQPSTPKSPSRTRFSNSDAGSSLGSCGTSLPRTARLRIVWRSCLIWSARTVNAGSASSAKRASSRKVSGSGALRRARLAAVQPVARRLPLVPRRLQPVAQRHQFIDLGDDALLLGERRERTEPARTRRID